MKAKVWMLSSDGESFGPTPGTRVLETVAQEFGHDLVCEPISVAAAEEVSGVARLDAPAAVLADPSVDRQWLWRLQRAWSLDVRAWALGLPGTSRRSGPQDLILVSDSPEPGDTSKQTPGEAARRAFRKGCALAQQRWGLLTEVEGLNFQADGLAGQEQDFPDVLVHREPLAVAAQALSQGSRRYDVVVGGHAFAEWWVRSLASTSAEVFTWASLGEGPFGLYQPAGQDAYRSILTAAMVLRHSLGLGREAVAVEDAVRQTRMENRGAGKPPAQFINDVTDAVLGFLSNDFFYSRAV